MPASVVQELAGLYAATYRKTKFEVVSQIMEATPGLKVFSSKGRIKKQAGGIRIVVDLEYEKNPSVQWIDMDTGTVDTTKHDPITENQYEWKLISGTVWATHKVASQNAGPFRIGDLQKAFLQNVKATMAQELETAIFGSAGDNEPYGLQDLVADDPTTGTIGVINRATYPWFRNGAKDMSGLAFSSNGEAEMRKAFMTIQRMGDPRDIVIFCDMDTYGLYEDLVGEKFRIQDKELADIGFPHVAYRGRPVFWSPQCPSGHMYFLDLGYIWLVVNSLVYFDLSEFIPAQNNIDMAAHLLTQCQMVTSRPKSTYVLFNIS